MLSVDGVDLVLGVGDNPLFRELSMGATGPDVTQLQTFLTELGLSPGPVDGGFVHLDVKPSNVILRVDRVLLLDFDICLPVGAQRSKTKPRGTRFYIPPEQIRCEPAAPTMDLFALGALLYEAACGFRAFDVETDDLSTQTAARLRGSAYTDRWASRYRRP